MTPTFTDQVEQEAKKYATEKWIDENDIEITAINPDKFDAVIFGSTCSAVEQEKIRFAEEFVEWMVTMDVQRIGKSVGWEVHKLADNGLVPLLPTKELIQFYINQLKAQLK